MSKITPEFQHTYSLIPEWQQKFVDYLGGVIEGDKMQFSSDLISGTTCFLEVNPDVSVIIIDSTLKKPLRFTRIPYDSDDFWIINYDLSDSFSKHIVDQVNHKTGYKSKLNFAIIDNKIRSTYIATVNQRIYALRLFIRKSYLRTFFTESEFEKDFKDVFDDKKNKMFFYGHIDSRSKLILYNLKQQSIDSPNFKFLLKGTAYDLLGYLIERLNIKMPSGIYFEKDIDAVMRSQEHLLSNLLIPFPGMQSLADIANMSLTKYGKLYNNIFGMSPSLFFKNEKLLLAKELLESGNFKLISDVAYELGYNKTSYFSSMYRKYFEVLPNIHLKIN